MRIEGLRWTGFRIPLREPMTTARSRMAFREGLIVQVMAGDGTVGLGEISPLPEAGGNGVGEALVALKCLGRGVVGRDPQEVAEVLHGGTGDVRVSPSQGRAAMAAARAGLDIAVSDLLARGAGMSVAALIAPRCSDGVEVNALVSAPGLRDACEAAATAAAEGFRSVKLKVGSMGESEEELERVRAVRQTLGPDVRLRLDANGAWSADEAIRMLDALEPCELEFVEQPVPPGTIDALRRVREAVRVPIAADEDIVDTQAARRVLEARAAQILVVKPMIVGGLLPAREIVTLAEDHGASVVVTTTIDTGVGTAAALHLAATLPSGGPASGLATAGLLEADLLTRSLPVCDGRMSLPSGPGLGVQLDENQIRSYAQSEGEIG